MPGCDADAPCVTVATSLSLHAYADRTCPHEFLCAQNCLHAVQTHLRGYQERAVRQALQASTIVVLPTGSGKTLIAAAVAVAVVSRKPAAKVLVIVPSEPLMEQQARALRTETGFAVAHFKGGMQNPSLQSYQALVALPQALRNLSARNARFAISNFALIVFDEVHHVIKKHPYRALARQMQALPACQRPRVLGLTASLTYATGPGSIPWSIYMGISAAAAAA